MQLDSAAVLLLLAGLVALAAGERQRFCYKRVGYTRKYGERQRAPTDGPCQGDSCDQPTAGTHYKTEVVYRTERHCCAGYQGAGQSADSCVPVCSRGCPQGEACTAPNRCACAEGYERNSEGRCVAVAASLLGDELRTLPAQVLSYIGALLDGVTSLAKLEGNYGLGHALDSMSADFQKNRTSRAALDEHLAVADAGPFSSACSLEGASGALERPWNSSQRACLRPLLLPLAAAVSR